MSTEVEKGILKKIIDKDHAGPVNLVVSGLQMKDVSKLCGIVSDTERSVQCVFNSRLVALHKSNDLTNRDILNITNYTCTSLDGIPKFMVLDATVLGKYDGDNIPEPPAATQAVKACITPASQRPPVSPSEMPATPAMASGMPLDLGRTPASAMMTPPMVTGKTMSHNQENRQPGSGLPVAKETVRHQPIRSLNPYIDKWTIKVKVEKKQPLKNANIKGEQTSILTAVLVDSEGTQIEGTFWRDAAEQMDRSLQEGSVYYMSSGALQPANRKYSSIDNDYRINFNNKSQVLEAPNEDGSSMKARCNFVKIDCLASRIAKKVPVDIVGVVTNVGAIGSVKRKIDDTEFVRRDITIVDQSRKSVIVTLWRDQAEVLGARLEALDHPVLVLAKVRVGDFNGVSVSVTYASTIEVNPEGYPEARELKEWWDLEGSSATFAPAGDSVARPGVQHLSKYQPLAAIVPADRELSAADPPIYATLKCMVTRVPEQQNFYYEANPATNKKVESNGSGGWVEVGTGTTAESMQRRYILNASVLDFTTESHINVFNDQAVAMLGKTADELHAIKEEGEEALGNALKVARHSEWILEVMAKPREYNGKTKMRINVRSASKIDYSNEATRMVRLIEEMCK